MGIVSRLPLRALTTVAFVLIAACGSHSPGPTTPTPATNPPQIACPVDITVSGVAVATQTVTYDAPRVSDGAAPVTTTCSPDSGASFVLGSTTVSCQASDAQARKATCSFNVTLKGFSIALKKYDLLGDSFAAGENGRLPAVIDEPNSFPVRLQASFDAVYPGQGVTVIPHGDSGKRIDAIVENIRKYVPIDKPDAVLVEGGYNDLLTDCGQGPASTPLCQTSLKNVQTGFLDCIRKSKEASATVQYLFVATMTPPGPVLPGAPRDRRISNDAIVQENALIRQVVASQRAVLVDVYPLFVGHEAEYVDTDGLHLRPAGYQAMADAFFAAVQQTVAQAPLSRFRFPF
jgi:lysophospholipase L1-like esterase